MLFRLRLKPDPVLTGFESPTKNHQEVTLEHEMFVWILLYFKWQVKQGFNKKKLDLSLRNKKFELDSSHLCVHRRRKKKKSFCSDTESVALMKDFSRSRYNQSVDRCS
jgi:hypothetical protein